MSCTSRLPISIPMARLRGLIEKAVRKAPRNTRKPKLVVSWWGEGGSAGAPSAALVRHLRDLQLQGQWRFAPFVSGDIGTSGSAPAVCWSKFLGATGSPDDLARVEEPSPILS